MFFLISFLKEFLKSSSDHFNYRPRFKDPRTKCPVAVTYPEVYFPWSAPGSGGDMETCSNCYVDHDLHGHVSPRAWHYFWTNRTCPCIEDDFLLLYIYFKNRGNSPCLTFISFPSERKISIHMQVWKNQYSSPWVYRQDFVAITTPKFTSQVLIVCICRNQAMMISNASCLETQSHIAAALP